MCKSCRLFCTVQKCSAFQRIDVIEKVHTFACKRFLNVPLKTPDKMVYGDLERYPLFVNSCIRAVKHWFKLLQMKENRLPKKAYHMQINMETNGKCCWASRLRDLLCKFGFGFVWLQKSVCLLYTSPSPRD